MTSVSSQEHSPSIENKGEVLSNQEHSEAPKASVREKGSIKALKLDNDRLIGERRMELQTKQGSRIGQAEYRWLTTPDLVTETDVEIHRGDLALAPDVEDKILNDNPEQAKELVSRQLTENHLKDALMLVFREFKAMGGDVCEATNLYFDKNLQLAKDVEATSSRNFIISQSGEEKMRGLLGGQISLGFADLGGSRFSITSEWQTSKLGDNGFSVVWRAKDPVSGKEVKYDLNFFYGAEDEEIENEEVYGMPEKVAEQNFGGIKKPEEGHKTESENV